MSITYITYWLDSLKTSLPFIIGVPFAVSALLAAVAACIERRCAAQRDAVRQIEHADVCDERK